MRSGSFAPSDALKDQAGVTYNTCPLRFIAYLDTLNTHSRKNQKFQKNKKITLYLPKSKFGKRKNGANDAFMHDNVSQQFICHTVV